MPETDTLVINTSPMIALVAALGDLQVLKMYQQVQVPFEVQQELLVDEAAGRRAARLHGLSVTGSAGILLRAQREGYTFSMREAIARMKAHGIWLSDTVVRFALEQTGEDCTQYVVAHRPPS
jgi:predicted nucleic acid-binding protein